MEMRGSLGLKLDDLKTLHQNNLKNGDKRLLRKKIYKFVMRFNRDISNPFKGSDAWREISNQSGYKNQYGGALPKFQDAGAVKLLSKGYDLLSKVTRSNYNPLVIPIKKLDIRLLHNMLGLIDQNKRYWMLFQVKVKVHILAKS
jgi:hypothetical protein